MSYYDDIDRKRWRAVAATIFLFVTGFILIGLYFAMAGVMSDSTDSGYEGWDALGDMFSGMGNILGVAGFILIIVGVVSAIYAATLMRGPRRRPPKKMPRRTREVLRPKYR
jgi:uncharacterized membrane protein